MAGACCAPLLTPSLGPPRATKVAARVGQGFALLFGLAGLLMGNVFLLLIALFVLMGAQGESQQVQVRSTLEKLSVHELMEPPHAALSPHATLEEAVNEFTLHRMMALPVVEEDGRVLGVLTLQQVRSVAESTRSQERVATHLKEAVPLQVDDTGWEALRRLSRERLPMLPVAADGRWVGLLSEGGPLPGARDRRAASVGEVAAREGLARPQAPPAGLTRRAAPMHPPRGVHIPSPCTDLDASWCPSTSRRPRAACWRPPHCGRSTSPPRWWSSTCGSRHGCWPRTRSTWPRDGTPSRWSASRCRRRVGTWRRWCGSRSLPRSRATTRLEVGPVASTVVRIAELEKSELIVVGTHGRRGLARMLLGSVAHAVISHAKVPVLTVPTPGERG